MLQCPRCGRQFSNDVMVCPSDHTPLQADDTVADVPLDPLLGRVFDGKYRLDERLGSGGMGTVYRATHLLIDRPVALKVLSQRFVGDQTAQQRFRREARAAGRMQHPNAVTVNDFGATEDGYLYIVMELLEGRTLRDLLAHEAPFDPARAVSIILQTASAVGAAHDAGLIHRDLKPANIFIVQRPNVPAVVKVLDFGVAKFIVEEQDDDYNTLTQVGAIIGTPRYMSPEQCSGAASLTPASDVYSLGIILYEMLTGVVPFSADTPLAVALKQVTEQPQPPHEIIASLPEPLERIVLTALTKDPNMRPRDANELRQEVFATAESLGLEHAESPNVTTFERLRSAGTESPSGSLVIDLATLRQVQAATGASGATAEDAPNQTVRLDPAAAKPDFHRVNVPVAAPKPRRSQLVVAGIILLIAILGSVVLAARWWRGANTNPDAVNVAASASPTPSPAETASPSPSPTPTAQPTNRPSRRRQEKPSTAKKILNKLKGIFR
jgi:eukaryotic-like serine/threonine-protein kinase